MAIKGLTYVLDDHTTIHPLSLSAAPAIGTINLGDWLVWVDKSVRAWEPTDGFTLLAGIAMGTPDENGMVQIATYAKLEVTLK